MKKKNIKKDFNFDDFDFLNSTCMTECTGLIPSAPKDENEEESYFDIVKFSPEDINIYNK